MGNKLFSEVTELTGLPEELIGDELKDLLQRKGISPEQVTLESLRGALAEYLESIHESMAAEDAAASQSNALTDIELGSSVFSGKSRLPTQ